MKSTLLKVVGGFVVLVAGVLLFALRADIKRDRYGENDDVSPRKPVEANANSQNELLGRSGSGKYTRVRRREAPNELVRLPGAVEPNRERLFNINGDLDADAAMRLGINSGQIADIGKAIDRIEDDLVSDFFDNATTEVIGSGEEVLVYTGSKERAKELSDDLENSIRKAIEGNPLRDQLTADIVSDMRECRGL